MTLKAGKKNRDAVSILVGATIVGLLAYGSYARNEIWRSEISLWVDCVRKSPEKFRPRSNLSVALARAGKSEEASAQFAQAINHSRKMDIEDMKMAIKEFKFQIPGKGEVTAKFEDLFELK